MSQTPTIDEKIVYDILTILTKHPEDIQIKRHIDDEGVAVLSIKVNATDMGIVIGKSGSMATAFKTLIKAVGKVNDVNIRIIFEEPEGSLFTRPKITDKLQPLPIPSAEINNISTTPVLSQAPSILITPTVSSDHTHNFDHDLDDLALN